MKRELIKWLLRFAWQVYRGHLILDRLTFSEGRIELSMWTRWKFEEMFRVFKADFSEQEFSDSQ